MICLETVKRFCKEYWKIENYQEAINDTEQVWDCHHRHEIDWVLPREELIAISRYYDVHYSELIFLTHREHTRLHHTGLPKPKTKETIQKISDSKKGIELTEEWREKLSESHKGKQHSDNTKRKIGESNKGKVMSEESRRKISASSTKYIVTAEELYNLYIVQGLSLNKIAKIYGCDPTTIQHKLKKFNISKSKS